MKLKISVPYMLCGILFVVCLITANLLETKVICIGSLTLTGGFLVFPISYIINDCITEVWGFKHARLVIWSGFAMNIFVMLMGFLAVKMPAPPFWNEAEHFDFVFAFAPRIVSASMAAFVLGSLANSLMMSKLKTKNNEQRFSIRAILSTLIGETIDSVIFFPIAFGGLINRFDLLKIMVVQIVLKTAYEAISLPLTITAVRWLQRIENNQIELKTPFTH